jgi:phage gp29-like protein
MGTTHAKMFYLKEVEVAIKLQTVIQDQLVRRLTLWNYGPTCPVPKYLITTEDEQDLVQRIGVDSTAQSMGVPITKQYMQETYGYPEPGAQDEVLVRPQGAGAGLISSGAAQNPSFTDAEAIHNAKEVQQLMDSLRVSVTDQYAKRIHEIAAAVQGGGIQ